MKRICVYCGSSPGKRPDYIEAARALAQELVNRGIHLVYGGASVGLMGEVANAVLAGGGEVTGVIPKALDAKEISHPGLTELFVVESMHERKSGMAQMSDGFIALPGGLGTLEEIFEVLTWAQLGMHEKPCAMLNVNGYYDGLEKFIDHSVEEGFVRPEHRHLLLIEEDPASLLDSMQTYQPPGLEKWIGRSQT